MAEGAALADAAATIIANAVDLAGHSNIIRVPASGLDPDSDLGDRLVTQHVGALSDEEVSSALDAGRVVAESLACEGLIHSAALHLRRETRIVYPAHERLSGVVQEPHQVVIPRDERGEGSAVFS